MGWNGIGFEMDRLQRSCRQLVWLNPLLRYDGFERAPASGRCCRMSTRSGRSTTSRRWPISAPRSRRMQNGKEIRGYG